MKPVPHGEPYAGKLHVRFDEGAGVPDEGRPALLYSPLRPYGKILKADCGFGLDDSKSSDALLLRCSDAEVGQDRASGVD